MHLVQEIGSYAGFAAVVGLAVLSALYFSQARDVKRLREWAGRAPERAAEQEARIAAQAQAQAAQAQEQRTAAAAAAGAATVAAPAVRPQAAPPAAGAPAPPPPTLTSARAATPPPSTPILGSVLPDEPWYRRISWPAPRYIALILVGVLVIGAGAAYGISKLGSGGGGTNAADISPSGGGGSSSGSHRGHSHRVVAIKPGSITVAVLNGTTVTGLAATVADKVEQAGFKRGNTTNALTQGQQAESVVEYARGDKDQARLVANRLGISQIEPVDPQTQGIAGDATVTVIVGADKANG